LPATVGQLPSQEVIVGHSDVGSLTVDAGSVLTTETGGIGWAASRIGRMPMAAICRPLPLLSLSQIV
jgi:hypothetical protein